MVSINFEIILKVGIWVLFVQWINNLIMDIGKKQLELWLIGLGKSLDEWKPGITGIFDKLLSIPCLPMYLRI